MNLDLSERRRRILKAVIQQYIETATPVASQDLARQMGVSSATVRNEMSALEEAGLLTHLHTSAGRVPTDTGYRFFVENLMDRAPLSAQEQRTIKHQFYQVRSDFDQWIHLAAAVLSRTAHAAAVVTPPRAYESRFKHLELIAINDMTVLMVLVGVAMGIGKASVYKYVPNYYPRDVGAVGGLVVMMNVIRSRGELI